MFDDWNFKQKPSGLWKRMLGAPVYLFRWKLGFVLGERFVLITHIGRTSGNEYQTPVEVVEHDTTSREFVVCSLRWATATTGPMKAGST